MQLNCIANVNPIYYLPINVENNQPLSPPAILNRIKIISSDKIDNKSEQRKIKITASILAVALGPFGVHRLYLGTSPLVPAVYVATVGGGVGILPFIDLVTIVFAKDISPYMNNKKIFMWAN